MIPVKLITPATCYSLKIGSQSITEYPLYIGIHGHLPHADQQIQIQTKV